MTAIDRCPLLDVKTGVCHGITLNILSWPSMASFGTGGVFVPEKRILHYKQVVQGIHNTVNGLKLQVMMGQAIAKGLSFQKNN